LPVRTATTDRHDFLRVIEVDTIEPNGHFRIAVTNGTVKYSFSMVRNPRRCSDSS
jgi:hypothetical protein